MLLQGKKILLRPVIASDAEALFEWENDPENRQADGSKTVYTKKQINDFIAGQKDIYLDKQLRLMICLPADKKSKKDRAIGCIDLFDYTDHLGSAHVGILVSKKFRKKGYASEALFLLIRYSFDVLNLLELRSTVLKDNEASLLLFKGQNFKIMKGKKNDEHNLVLKNT